MSSKHYYAAEPAPVRFDSRLDRDAFCAVTGARPIDYATQREQRRRYGKSTHYEVVPYYYRDEYGRRAYYGYVELVAFGPVPTEASVFRRCAND